jgi:hypothetical protein
VRDAVARAVPHLHRSRSSADPGEADEPALWHDKDLYRPAAIVRAGTLAALHLARTAASAPASKPVSEPTSGPASVPASEAAP